MIIEFKNTIIDFSRYILSRTRVMTSLIILYNHTCNGLDYVLARLLA